MQERTRGGDPKYAVVQPDLTQTDLELIRSCEPFSQRQRPDCRRLAMCTGSELAYENGYPIVGTAAFVMQHFHLAYPEFERGGWIEINMIGQFTSTAVNGTIQLAVRENNVVGDPANKLLDHAVRPGPNIGFATVFAATTPVIVADPGPMFVRITLRVYSCGRAIQQWFAEWTTMRGATFAGPVAFGGGQSAVSMDPENGDRELQLRVTLAGDSTTAWLVRNSTVMQFGIRHDGA